jgi:GrpB-like predicted nucleotidyltransferase (UPF0157 family)
MYDETGGMGVVEIVPPRATWPGEYADIAASLAAVLGDSVVAIDHIGSTSVPGLPAKDVIDVQVSVVGQEELVAVCDQLAEAGYRVNSEARDHPVPGEDTNPECWAKGFASEPVGSRRCHIHVRVLGRPNQRYALLFRDYLRCHPPTAAAYATFKQMAAALRPEDSARYAAFKDPVCDLIYLPARQWAAETGWH